jgi:hypothetical protein
LRGWGLCGLYRSGGMTQGGGAAIDIGRETTRPVSGNDREKRGARRADCGPNVGVAGLH